MWKAVVWVLILGTLHLHAADLEQALHLLMKEEDPSCSSCGYDEHGESLSSEGASDLRLEFIKAQILQKLDLWEAPRVTSVRKLPLPLQVSPTVNPFTESPLRNDLIPDQLILLAISTPQVQHSSKWPSVTFKFHIPNSVNWDNVGSASLWVYKKADFVNNGKQVLNIGQITPDGFKRIESHHTVVKEGWVMVDITQIAQHWVLTEQLAPSLAVECQQCGYSKPWQPISLDADFKPLLVLNPDPNKKQGGSNRGRRNLRCVHGMTECCRERLLVNFSDIGWDDWILTPRTYEAYFCTGSCATAASATLAGTLYTSMMTKLFQRGKKMNLIPCCTATEYSSLHMIYMKDNDTLLQTNIPNMVVESCGCF